MRYVLRLRQAPPVKENYVRIIKDLREYIGYDWFANVKAFTSEGDTVKEAKAHSKMLNEHMNYNADE